MAAQQPARRSASPFNHIDDWMTQRRADVLRLSHETEAAGRQAWAQATRAGQDIAARTPAAVRELGARALDAERKLEKQAQDAGRSIRKQVHAAAEPARRVAKKAGDQVLAGARGAEDAVAHAIRSTVASPAQGADGQGSWLDRSSAAKEVAGDLVRNASVVPGVAVGAWHTVKDAADVLAFATRLINPFDAISKPPGERAWDQAIQGGNAIFEGTKEAISNPRTTVDGVLNAGKRFYGELVPQAAPQAETFAGEMKRNSAIGLKQGERLFDVGSLFVGGAEAKGLVKLGRAAEEGAEKYVARGVPQNLAEYFAEPYSGMGHHFIPRSYRLPSWLGGGPIPKVISESPFFLVKPRDMTKGDFFQHHFKIDPSYHGGKVPARYGGGGWSGNDLGWKKHGPVGRIWNGAPAPLKVAAGSGMAAAGALVDEVWPEDKDR